MGEETMLKVPEIAKQLRVSEYTVRRWLREKQMHGVLMGDRGGYRVLASEVQRFLKERMEKQGSL
jgi:excisionase family DNA binding protein